ncbi:MAG TPA: immunoglobulin domain-containing protein, partial [Candidatus Binatia bacterium]|nr:immunoglobulin domain-containing protein [Candidatus Binatia bacterium]
QGIFSGFGRMAVHNGSNAFVVLLPSGTVTDLGPMAAPTHTEDGLSQYSWAYWGVAEFFHGATWIVNVRDFRTIIRTRVPDGLTETVATFTNLANMFSFTVSPGLERWYFEHDGQSQFGSGALTVGYADATFVYLQEPQPPRILRQPQSFTVTEGDTAMFSVKALGSAPLSYQWQFNGADLSGATGASLTLTQLRTNQAGNYQVAVSNALGSVTSSNATLTVRSAAECNFGPTNRPSITFMDALDSTTMGIAFDGVNYWSTAGGSARPVARYTAAGALVAAYPTPLDFRSIFTDPSGTVFARAFSDSTIYRQTSPGTFVASGTTLIGGVLDSQTAVVLNTEGTEYIAMSGGTVSRWRRDGSFLGTVTLSGFGQVANENFYPQNRGIAVAPSYWLTYDGNGRLSVWDFSGHRLNQVILEQAGTSFDSGFSLSYCNGRVFIVDSAHGLWRGYDLCVNVPPTILAQPESRTVLAGFNVTLSAAVFGKAPLSYQWRFNGADIPGATNATLLLNNVTTNQAGSYSFVVSNDLGSASSANALLAVVTSSAGTFHITSLSASNAVVVNDSALVGYDRGGIAASSQEVFFTGNGTERFDLADLTGGTALGRTYDALVSELGTEK